MIEPSTYNRVPVYFQSLAGRRAIGRITLWVILIAAIEITLSSTSYAQYDYCSVSCTASVPATGIAGVATGMSGSANYLYCTGSPTYQWSFGDGESASGSSVTHTYANPGNYAWNLTVSVDGYSASQGGQITINARTNPLTSTSAASYSGSRVASGSLVAAFGSNLTTTSQAADTIPLPTSLAGLSLKVKDIANVERLAGLLYAGPGQVNYQVPPGSASGNAQVTVNGPGGSTASGTIEIAAVAPGLFSADANGKGIAAAVALRVKPDGSQSSEPVGQYDAGQGKYVTVPIDLGPETDQVFLVLFGTGIRGFSALSAVTVSIGGATSAVDFAGPQGTFVGVDQINVRLSRSLIGRGEVDVGMTVDGQAANNVRVSIR
jgi:uncharacterized protein (TIGR03437 family)